MRKIAFLLMVALLTAGCGGGGGGGTTGGASSTLSFYVWDFVEEDKYTIQADKVAEGDHCYIYLEQGMAGRVTESAIDDLVEQFDNAIYQGLRDAFGSEPNPGVDGDPKIYILLMDIKDGYSGGSYIAGYFDSDNEHPRDSGYWSESNAKEIFFMDVDPGVASGATFRRVLAHEFQHMIHWEQKTNRLGFQDDTWLDEAMSEVAPYYAGYGPNYSRILTFESGSNRSDSLTLWGDNPVDPLPDYAVVYMWAQYIADRFPGDAFRNILASDRRGVASVEEYLISQEPTLSFLQRVERIPDRQRRLELPHHRHLGGLPLRHLRQRIPSSRNVHHGQPEQVVPARASRLQHRHVLVRQHILLVHMERGFVPVSQRLCIRLEGGRPADLRFPCRYTVHVRQRGDPDPAERQR